MDGLGGYRFARPKRWQNRRQSSFQGFRSSRERASRCPHGDAHLCRNAGRALSFHWPWDADLDHTLERWRVGKIHASDVSTFASGKGNFRGQPQEQRRYAHARIPCFSLLRSSQPIDLAGKKDGRLTAVLRYLLSPSCTEADRWRLIDLNFSDIRRALVQGVPVWTGVSAGT